MLISETIKALEALATKHGDVDVTVWQYSGGMDDLCDVAPEFSDQLGMVVMRCTTHDPLIQS